MAAYPGELTKVPRGIGAAWALDGSAYRKQRGGEQMVSRMAALCKMGFVHDVGKHERLHSAGAEQLLANGVQARA